MKTLLYMQFIKRGVVIALYFLLSFQTSFVMAVQNQQFVLGKGDIVDVFVWKYPDLSRQVSVRPDGRINYPLVGQLTVEGKGILEVEDMIRDGLKKHIRDPQVNVGLDTLKSYGVYVLGEVLRPGYFSFQGSISLVQIIANAGGFTPFAYKKHILVVRNTGSEEERIVFDYNEYLKGQKDILLQTGDTVVIEANSKSFK